MSTTSELKDFVSSAGSKLLVIDVRHPDASVEPSDAKSIERTGLPDPTNNYRPQAINLPWSRESNSMELPNVDKDTPIITHCGGGMEGTRGQGISRETWIYKCVEWWWTKGAGRVA